MPEGSKAAPVSTSHSRTASPCGSGLASLAVTTALVGALTALVGAGGSHKQSTRSDGRLETVGAATHTTKDFERVVTSALQKAGVTGLSCAILNDSKIAYTGQFGWKDKDHAARPDEQTAFYAASLSKPVFAYLVMVLAEEGAIDLDKPLQAYLERLLPGYQKYSDLARDNRYVTITPRMVLSHTSGLPNLRSTTDDGRLKLQFEPGRRFSYSSEGIDLLQMVVEKVTGNSLETLAREKIFVPLGMSRTSYIWRDDFAKNIALPHNEYEWPDDPFRVPAADAAGSLTTTARDYARFLVGMLTAKGKRRNTIDSMLAPVVSIRSERMFGRRAEVDTDTNAALRLSWGLGWGLFETPAGRAFFHTGHAPGAQNYVVAFKDRGIGIVLLSNSDNFEGVAREIVAAGIGDTYSPFDWLGYVPFDPARRKPAPPRRVAMWVAPEIIAPYAGKYQIGDRNIFLFVRAEGSRLHVSDDGQSWDEVFAQSATLFFFKGRNITLTFIRDADGTVTRLDIDSDGKTTSARRIE
jgi:CubicO group peptidase (beta-lactamase class C family)